MEEQKMRGLALAAGKMAVVLAALIFLYVYGSFLLETIISQALNNASLNTLWPLIAEVAILVAGTQIFLMISKFLISRYLENRGKKKEIRVILTLYSYLVWAFVGIFLLSTIFKDVGALITSIGLIGFGITFALQKPILNFVGWLTIVLTKPFNISDRIEVTGIRGDVLSINTMYTRVQGTRPAAQTKSDQIITIPNELILTNPVLNYSRMGDVYSDDITVSITYESNWRKAIDILESVTTNSVKKYLKNNSPVTFAEKKSWQEAVGLLQEASKRLRRGFVKQSVQEKIEILRTAEIASEIEIPKPRILMSLGASSIDLNVLYKTDLHSIRDTKHSIVRSFMEAVEKCPDIGLAYPHMQIVYDEKHGKYAGQRKLFMQEQELR
ncbi:MAG TPA: mechanosensitive ion channel [Candidatus Diapherotrites archaeon]|uniref:Mechanosensitive ion channel n=1 Tax=Candidatus Iainarchaeum sp. TaxID=3101447 RepID=A0A7J4IY87_9ARCH|nr:mechanosensitive ion channel [Candidatus Diapherotrites archaeon]